MDARYVVATEKRDHGDQAVLAKLRTAGSESESPSASVDRNKRRSSRTPQRRTEPAERGGEDTSLSCRVFSAETHGTAHQLSSLTSGPRSLLLDRKAEVRQGVWQTPDTIP